MADYEIGARLGGGGMAEVFEGTMRGAEGVARRVAIKRVLPGYSNNPTFAKMFIEEAQLSSRLAHPNIVSVLDFDRDAKGQLFLAMELVEGVDLHALAATGLLPFPVVIHVIAEVLRGLGYAHEVPLVHRDVSPHNVLLSWGGEVKVSDFGIAKARDATDATVSGMLKGKPAYMSPEQANGQPLDGRSDLFAVGVIMWELLTGRRLFAADDTRATLAAVLFGKIPRPRKLRHEVPKDLDRITMRLLERQLHSRHGDAAQVLLELRRCWDAAEAGRDIVRDLLGRRFARDVPTRVQRSASTSTGTQVDASVAFANAETNKPRWRLLLAVFVVIVGGAGFGGYQLALHLDGTPPRDGPAMLAAGTGSTARRLVNPLDLPERCWKYLEVLRRLSGCAFLPPAEHARWVKAEQEFREALADIKLVKNVDSIEVGCAVQWEHAIEVVVDRRCQIE